MKNTYYITLALLLFAGYSHGMARPLRRSQEDRTKVIAVVADNKVKKVVIDTTEKYFQCLPGANPKSTLQILEVMGYVKSNNQVTSNEIPEKTENMFLNNIWNLL